MPKRSTGQVQAPELRRFVRFLAVGALNTAWGYMIFAGAIWLGLSAELALLVATIVGVAFNFLTTGRIVFASRDGRRLPRFLLVYVAGFGLNAIALRALIDSGVPSLFAQPIVLPVVIVLTFLGMRGFVFQEGAQ